MLLIVPEPMEFAEQDWFLNCTVELETGLNPRELLAAALRIEESLGCRRSPDTGVSSSRRNY
jgi:2-amino-4-hydroxy-6-hydroxymethyldihydropteridine diphosphokinase